MAPHIRAGQLRWKVAIEESEETIDDHGGTTESWTKVANRQAMIQPLTASEKVDTDRFTTEVTHKITLRFYAGLTTSHRIVHDGRTYNLAEVIDVDLRGIRDECIAEEVTQ